MLRKVFLFVVSLCLMQNVSIANSDYEFEFYHILNGEVIAENRDNVIISFDMVNDTSNYYSKLFYVPMLEVRGTDTANITYLPYQVYEPKEFSLKPYETKTLVYECKLPKTLPNKKLMITANLYSEFYSEPFGKVAFNLKTVGDDFEGFLESDGISYFKPDKGEIIKADKEFTLDKTNLPKMYIKLKSSFEIEKIVYPYYALYERNNAVNKPFYTDYGEKIVFKSGETKEVELDLPSILGSEKYLMTLSFVDGSGNKVSNLYEYKYVISGENAKITEIVFDSEESKVKAYLYGTDELKDTEVEIKVYDKNKNLLFNKKAIIDLKTEDMYVDTILENISNDKVDVTVGITYKGKELVTKTEEVKLNIEAGVDKFLDIKGKECERAVKILNSLEIINGYPNNTYKPENLVTRAEFSTIVTKLMDLEISDEDTKAFSDISDHWAKSYINVLNKNGFVSGYPDGTFGPGNNVTYQEALTILLNSLGYKNAVNESSDTWPYNYIMKAMELGLTRDVNIENFSKPANRGDIAIMALKAYSLK